QSPVTTVSSGISNYFQRISSLRTAQSENDVLKQRIQELEVELQSRESLAVETERLRSLLELKEQTDFKIKPAQIIGRDPSAWFDTIIINRGSSDGVRLNMPVVTKGGLVGRVSAVSFLTAQVWMITKERISEGGVIGELGASNALGVVSGTGKKELLEMGYVPGSVEVQVGDSVYTTGQEGIYPAGLKIGEIVEVRTGSATVPQQIFIKPSANFSSLEEVAVVLYEPPPRPEYDKSLPNAVKKK
ncbi:MAG: rod shape-determining protein MreC, partial [Pyrinomonadaceae bacterium]